MTLQRDYEDHYHTEEEADDVTKNGQKRKLLFNCTIEFSNIIGSSHKY